MKKRVNIWIDAELHDLAKDLGLNVSRVCERGLEASVNLLSQKDIGPAYELPNTEETKEATGIREPEVDQPEQKEVSKPLTTKEVSEPEPHEEEETEPPDWACPLTGKMGGYQRCERKTKQDPENCNITCKALTKYYRGIVFGAELTTEEAEQEEAEEKAESTKASKTEVAKKPEPTKSEPVTPTQEAPKPTPEKRPETLRMGASEPQEPSVAEETPKDQPGMKAPETVEDPDPLIQQADRIRTLREKSEKKPKTRGQQTFGPEKES